MNNTIKLNRVGSWDNSGLHRIHPYREQFHYIPLLQHGPLPAGFLTAL